MKSFKYYPYILGAVVLVHVLLSFLGYPYRVGDKFSYWFFCTSFLVVIVQSLSSRISISYFFFGIMLWLGFYCKVMVHSIVVNYPYAELIGNFNADGDQWTLTMMVSGVGALGCVSAKGLFDIIFRGKGKNLFKIPESPREAPSWYSRSKHHIYILFFIVSSLLAFVNIKLGINLSGLAAVTVLPWPLNAVIGWLLYIGLAIAVSQLCAWEYAEKRTNKWSYLASVFEGLTSSVSIISRGLFVFHLIPVLFVNVFNRIQFSLSWRRLLFYLLVTVGAFFISMTGVTLIRSALFADESYIYDFYDAQDDDAFLFDLEELHREAAVVAEVRSAPEQNKTYSIETTIEKATAKGDKIDSILNKISTLILDRWIGIEGVMAIVGYPDRNMKLMTDSLVRKPKVGELDIFEKIVRSPNQPSFRYSFASIPGPIAFFFYSNSLSIVFLGLFLFTLFLVAIDQVLFRIFGNIFLSAQIGFYLANCLAQFGISPYPLLVSFVMTACGLAALYVFNLLVGTRRA